jgi:ferrous iron transport protein B
LKTRATNVLEYAPAPSLTERVDRILLHKVWGLLAFALIMAGIFMAIFFAAAPLMDATEGGIGWLGDLVAGWLPEGVLKDLWTDAIVAGVGGVLVFVPQIAILFGLLAILEDSGYLARAAFIMDRVLGKVGLSGKAFVPLLSGFACAIPGIMAARTIASPRDRLRTIFVLPFTSCSARLPVYTLLIGAFFASYAWWVRGGIMLGLYLLGIIAAFATAWAWKARSREAVSSFLMELPSYKVPQASTVARVMLTNTKAFVTKAGTIIFALSVILWATTYWPRLPETAKDSVSKQAELAFWSDKSPAADSIMSQWTEECNSAVETAVASEQLRHSLAGRFGHLIEPVIKPLGFDWKMGVGMVGAFGAREVFVSTMGIVYAAGDSEDDPQPLEQAMQEDKYDNGTNVWRPLVALNMLVWFVLAMQCLSTVAIVKRETGGWKWPLLQLAYMNGLAYGVCLVIYQVGKALGA